MIKELSWDQVARGKDSLLRMFAWLFCSSVIWITVFVLGLIMLSLALPWIPDPNASKEMFEHINYRLRLAGFFFGFSHTLRSLALGLMKLIRAFFEFIEIDEENRTIKKYLQIKNKKYFVETIELSDVIEVREAKPVSRIWDMKSLLVVYGPKRQTLVVRIAKSPLNSKIWKYMEQNGIKLWRE